MTPATIIREAQADGVRLALSPTGTIKATGDSAAVNRWLAVIREHKAGIVEVLRAGAGDTATIRQLSAPLTAEDERAIRAWLALIEETDPAIIAGVIAQCRRDADARDYFIERAAAELPKPDPFHDDQHTHDLSVNTGRN
jgi:predicted component of type VI protein secretion system